MFSKHCAIRGFYKICCVQCLPHIYDTQCILQLMIPSFTFFTLPVWWQWDTFIRSTRHRLAGRNQTRPGRLLKSRNDNPLVFFLIWKYMCFQLCSSYFCLSLAVLKQLDRCEEYHEMIGFTPKLFLIPSLSLLHPIQCSSSPYFLRNCPTF